MVKRKFLVFCLIASMLVAGLPSYAALAAEIAQGASIRVTRVTPESDSVRVDVTVDPVDITSGFLYYHTSPGDALRDGNRVSNSGFNANGATSFSVDRLRPGQTYVYSIEITFTDGSIKVHNDTFATVASVPVLPVLGTTSCSTFAETTATILINVTDTGNADITQTGAVYSTSNQNPTIGGSNCRTADVSGNAASVHLSGLEPNTTYYARSFATNQVGTAYGSATSFTTKSSGRTPSVTTGKDSKITATSAEIAFNVSDVGDSDVYERGVVYSSSNQMPTLDDYSKKVSGSGRGNATASLTGLSRSTTYYVRAYARNNQGVGYGSVISFRTASSSNEPDAVTRSVDEITASSAEVEIDIDSSFDVTERGVVYSSSNESPELKTSRCYTEKISGTTGEAVVMLPDLSRNTRYYVRAYAINRHGTGYGEVLEFVTESEDYIPTVLTVSASPIASDAIEVRIDVEDDNGSSIRERGVVYSRTEISPRLDVRSCSEEPINGRTGTATVELEKLSRNATYYVRAYATNDHGTAYGKVIEVALGSENVTTERVTSITGTSAVAVCYADYRSSVDVRELGVVYSTSNKMPTISDETVEIDDDDIGYGGFEVRLTKLVANKTYYLRAYARTGSGYEYGNMIEFKTTGSPTLTVQYRLPDGSMVDQQKLTFAAGTQITTAQLSVPSAYTLTNPLFNYTMPEAEDTITVYVQLRRSQFSVMAPNRPAGSQVRGSLSNNTLVLNGAAKVFPAVMIDDYNYLKLRDVAALLNGTAKQFEIYFDTNTETAFITSGRQYQFVGNELTNTLFGVPLATATTQRLVVNETQVSVASYNIGGYNYLRLRDIAILLDFAIEFNQSTGVATLRLDMPYSG